MDLGSIALGLFGLYQGAKALHRGLTSGEEQELSGPPHPANRQLPGRPGGPARPGAKVKTFEVRNLDDRMRYISQMARKGRLDPRMREFTVKLVSQRCGSGWCTPEKNWRAEAEAVFKGLRGRYYRYVRDTYGVDLYQHPKRTLQFGGGDCLPAGTLLLTENFEFVPIERLIIGQRIWGKDDWTTVTDAWFKGVLPVDAIHLNNGSTFRATADHKVYVALCASHPVRWTDGTSCACPVSERAIERIPVSKLEPGMVMISPERIAYGTGKQDPGRALIDGLYLSDGWCEENRFSISGLDGHAKEAQKHEVRAICERLGVETTWHEKHLRIRDKEWAQRMAQMGHRAPEKHALSINLEAEAAEALLRGILADSGANSHGSGRTFTTTSHELFLQARVLLKMRGDACGARFIVDHGGLGKNPIWRLQIRGRDHATGKNPKLLRVKEIDRAIEESPVYDISTSDHYVYLPEADVTVSNCDDATILLASALGSIGFKVKARVIQTHDADDWNHIYCLVEIPNAGGAAGREGKGGAAWLPMDLSMDKPPGWEAPRSMIKRQRDYPL